MSATPLQVKVPAGDAGHGEVRLCGVDDIRDGSGPRLLVAGDFCPGPGVPIESAWLPGARGADRPVLASLAESVDFSIVNLECPLGAGDATPKSGPRLQADPAWSGLLSRSGLSAVGLANNHAMDQGPSGLEATLAAVADAGLLCVGAGRDLAAAARPLFAQVGDRRIAIFAQAEHESGIASRERPGVSPLSPESSLRSIRAARQECDDVVVLLHAGNESYALPRPGLRETCRFFVDCGADAVLCAHSHIIGPVEWYAGAPIVYGLGNLYFPWPGQDRPAGWDDGLCVVLEFGDSISLSIVPTRFDNDRQGLRELPESEARELGAHLEALSARVADDRELERSWAAFVGEHRRAYLSALLGLSRAERLAVKTGAWPSWRLSRDRLPELLNVVRCESHREALLHLLEDENAKG